jgi:starch-binding outer membrane protein, SusD/RagB family
MKTNLFLSAFMVILVFSACHPKDDTTYPKITYSEIDSNFLQPAYLSLHAITGSNQSSSIGDIYQEQSFCTDECVFPDRGGDLFYGDVYGHFFKLFQHTWDATLPDIGTIWTISYNCVIAANKQIQAINEFFPLSGYSSREEYNTAILGPVAQLKMIRSLAYFYLIDFFGNVPIVTKYDSINSITYANNIDFSIGRRMLFDTIVRDINASIPFLSPDFDASTYGTFQKWAAFALLAKMYINAEVWTGNQKYNECVAVCDSIINSGIFSITTDYFSNFKQLNEDSKENIFVIPYNQNSTESYEGFYFMSLHYQSNLKYLTAGAAWNGFCALPDYYHSFDSIDVRREGWSIGAQFAADNTTPLVLLRYPYAGKTLNFTPDFIDVYYQGSAPYHGDSLNYLYALENNGARLVKYEIAEGLPHICLGVPLPIFRYADILMLKAEALMRKNGGVASSEAVNLVNQIRTRAGVILYNTSTLTMDELLAERGREFYYEGMRRQDLVRFGKFVRGTWGRNFSGPYQDQWFDRSAEKDYRNVFPIPDGVDGLGTEMHQNPGY